MFQACITKFRRNDFVSQPLNSSCIRAYKDNCRHFLPVANCLQINEYNFFSMEFPWQINCINFFLSWLPKSLCFKINNQQSNGLYQTFIVKMIKIVTFFLAFAMAVEHLINIEIEQWQISFVSGTSFGLLISY